MFYCSRLLLSTEAPVVTPSGPVCLFFSVLSHSKLWSAGLHLCSCFTAEADEQCFHVILSMSCVLQLSHPQYDCSTVMPQKCEPSLCSAPWMLIELAYRLQMVHADLHKGVQDIFHPCTQSGPAVNFKQKFADKLHIFTASACTWLDVS